MAKERGKTFRGQKVFAYAEHIGIGTTDYVLHELSGYVADLNKTVL